MTRDGEIPAIFNPKRVRTPSVVVTGDSSTNGPYSNNSTGGAGASSSTAVAPGSSAQNGGSGSGAAGSCGFSNVLTSSNPQITHQDSISSSQQDPNEVVIIPADTPTSAPGSHNAAHHFGGGDSSDTQTEQQQANGHGEESELRFRKLQACKESCCSELARKMYFGVCVTILMTASWVGATHCIKYMYKYRAPYDDLLNDDQDTSSSRADLSTELEDILAISDSSLHHVEDATEMFNIPPRQPVYFSAPFFAAWFFTNFSLLFFPIYLLGLVSTRKCEKLSDILGDVLRGFRERGFTVGRFLNRCLCFCILWLVTTYLYTLSLHVLYATDALALFATNVACVYLLSWVILHEQFVGVRIVAIILCDTGIALLAYMDGITESRTLSGVVLATLAGAGYAVFRVMFRKVMGDPPVSQIAFIFTALGFLNALLLWPVVLGLYLTGTESLTSESIPWNLLFAASLLLLVFHVLMQFSAAVTYNMFVTLGLITAVPVSGALDVILYSANFAGMKLAGVILIGIGFFLVMFPANWPDYITRLLRKSVRAILRYQCCCELAEIRYAHSMGSRPSERYFNRSASHHYRLSDGIHKVPSSFTLWPCEMTDLSPTTSGFLHGHGGANAQHHQQLLHHQQQQHQQTHQQHLQQQYHHRQHSLHQQHLQRQHSHTSLTKIHRQSSSHSVHGGGGRADHHRTTTGATGRLFSYFGNEQDHERKKSETSFFNLGFRRKSTVVYYAPAD
ncbi:uncharacterized protein LOC6727295 isoform X2 [Drosophila simulans]|uniref:Uncharacterized protein, isoform I n=1 Tax=Drosophila melanogaster TaxID=7227 RepID=B7Z0N3_DROME|nr:uncharacterized protein Dmel_CG42322, isoform I [Drosophila melanogaster]NP_001138090.1 uncharacterized protein Dmel_CG42322, isoform J [Drosophila melanogaster]XP_016033834.1 uncharacterized protein LOC6727295 isoform X2 [Drosophila simulans]XP_044779096.1 uncharacterized protein LOC6727295 isoform X2 [Drosophila simulans]ACL83545.1 uncharacterized protein Dmel_CG42322, isoform I [Drosophila melanogaster]ACL83546.1 uncharacterized protein Dmel_CG42322, isoform J [Drosophila melanogaster]K|eukprot:NP_001138089.1 uncharacterized protein Dmel_CG42322, isoform I [Drosophila melanogaster]